MPTKITITNRWTGRTLFECDVPDDVKSGLALRHALEKLYMGHWHGDEAWRERSCAEETLCGTTHCLAGWLQVCSTEPALRTVEASLAGVLAAPVASKMFYRGDEEAFKWLESRQYVQDTAEAEKRAAERAARKAQ